MNRRVIGLFLVLLLLGGGAGYALADATEPEAERASGPVPLTAVSPAVPTTDPRKVLPDPGVDPLAADLPSEMLLLQDGKRRAGVEAAIPVGWREGHVPGQNDWNYAVEGNPTNTYKLRISILKGTHVSIAAAKNGRLGALRAAEDEGNLFDLTVEDETDDTFIATYLDQGYLRVEMERFLVLDDTNDAYAVVAVTGRERDRDGLTDLVVRTAASLVAVEPVQPNP